MVWDEQEHWRSYKVTVKLDVTAVSCEIKNVLSGLRGVNVSAGGNAVILSGYVDNREVARMGGMIARAYHRNVVNALTYPPDLR